MLFGIIALIVSCEYELENPWDDLSVRDPQSWAPKLLQIEEINLHTAKLSWDFGDENIEGFKIDRKSGDEDWVLDYAILPKEQRSYKDSTAIPGRKTEYRIYAFAGNNSSSSLQDNKQIMFPQPADLKVKKLNNHSFQLSWADQTNGEEGFKIDRKIDTLWQNEIAVLPANQKTFTDTNIFRALDIEYRVYAYYKTALSAKTVATASTVLDAPEDLLFDRIALTEIKLSWTDKSDGEEGFIIERKKEGEDWIKLGTTRQLQYQDNSVPLNREIEYRISAYYGTYRTDGCSATFTALIPQPQNLYAEVANNTEATINWEYDMQGVEGFKIDRQVDEQWENDFAIVEGNDQRSFTDQSLNMEEHLYAYRVYAFYADDISAKTEVGLSRPTVSTLLVQDITTNSANCQANVSHEGGAPVTARGICWSKNENPDINGNHSNEGQGTGTFSSVLTGLEVNQNYNCRAYATNKFGIAYGQSLSFQTLVGGLATVETIAISEISTNSAKGGGNVTNEGDTPVSARGVCWSKSANPDLNDAHSTDGSGSGNYSSNLTNLDIASIYYVRAYATNAAGTAYGEKVVFQTNSGSIPHISTAPATNIQATTAISGGTISSQGTTEVTKRGVCWSESIDPDLNDSFTDDGGGPGTFQSTLSDLLPETTYYVRAYATNIAGTAYGNNQSFTTQTGDKPMVSTSPATNITATTATTGGTVTSEGDTPVFARGVCWSNSGTPDLNDDHTYNGTGMGNFVSELINLEANTDYYIRAYATNSSGTSYGATQFFTTTAGDKPMVSTSPITNITNNSATGGGTVTSEGDTPVSERGVCWSKNGTPDINDNHSSDGQGSGSFSSSLTNLEANTQYYVRAYASNTAGTAYGGVQLFTTTYEDCPPTVTDDEGNVYNTVVIGEQCWMKENLNIGEMIDSHEDMADNNKIEKYCLENSESACNTYGGLYQWNELMCYQRDRNTSRGLCPEGWHVPSQVEWLVLINLYGGIENAGGALKEQGTSHWNEPNTGATNISGFTGLPGAYRSSAGVFPFIREFGIFWSSTSENSTSAINYSLLHNSISLGSDNCDRDRGVSVRCIKD